MMSSLISQENTESTHQSINNYTHMKNLNEQLTKLVEESLNEIFVQAHDIADTKSGDISPDQHFQYLDIQRKLTKLLIEQVNQNL